MRHRLYETPAVAHEDAMQPPTAPAPHPRAWLAFLAVAVAVTGLQLATLTPRLTWGGDDYAGYIRNAWSLLHGMPYAMQGYIINPDMDIGIGAYPPMYPLLLVPAVALYGESYNPLDVWTVMLYGGALFALMLYARPATGFLGALLTGIAAGLGPFIYFWKDSVMSEFPFVLMLFLALLAERRFAATRGIGAAAAAGLAMAATVMTRAVGGALWPAWLLADLLRTRGLRWRVLLAVGGSVALVAAVMLWTRDDAFLQYLRLFHVNTMLQLQDAASQAPTGLAPKGLAHGPVPVSLADRLGVIADNLRRAPGSLSMLWGFGTQRDAALKTGLIGLADKVLTVLLLLGGAAGLLLRLRRGATAAEMFFIIELAGLMVMPSVLITTRLFLPLSVMLVMYAFVAARAVQQRLGWRLPLPQILCAAVLTASFTIAYAGQFSRPRSMFTLDKPPAGAFFEWVRANTDPQALFVTRSPRALILFTGRRGVDYHLGQVDDAFLAWERSLHADNLVLYVDLAEVRALAVAHGLPLTVAGLNQALDLYEAQFFGAYRDRFPLVYRNEWFRVYRVVP